MIRHLADECSMYKGIYAPDQNNSNYDMKHEIMHNISEQCRKKMYL